VTTDTTTPKARKPRKKPEWRHRLHCIRPGLASLDLMIGKKWFSYYVEPITCDWTGFLGFRLTKSREQQRPDEPSHYNVMLDIRADLPEDEPRLHDCDCMGFQAHGHKGTLCKHLAALLALHAAGELATIGRTVRP
jgi:hypothetical protein